MDYQWFDRFLVTSESQEIADIRVGRVPEARRKPPEPGALGPMGWRLWMKPFWGGSKKDPGGNPVFLGPGGLRVSMDCQFRGLSRARAKPLARLPARGRQPLALRALGLPAAGHPHPRHQAAAPRPAALLLPGWAGGVLGRGAQVVGLGGGFGAFLVPHFEGSEFGLGPGGPFSHHGSLWTRFISPRGSNWVASIR